MHLLFGFSDPSWWVRLALTNALILNSEHCAPPVQHKMAENNFAEDSENIYKAFKEAVCYLQSNYTKRSTSKSRLSNIANLTRECN